MNTYELIIGSFDPNSAASDANNRGGYLATITSTQEWNYIQSLITTNITYWLGGNDVAAEGQWVWNNGEVWAVEFWDDANPSNSGNAEHYLTAVHNNSQNSWNDTESFYSLSYLLEVNKLTTNPNDADSDDDGLSDGDEIANGTNPNIAESSGTVPINSWEQLGDIISNSGQPDGNALILNGFLYQKMVIDLRFLILLLGFQYISLAMVRGFKLGSPFQQVCILRRWHYQGMDPP